MNPYESLPPAQTKAGAEPSERPDGNRSLARSLMILAAAAFTIPALFLYVIARPAFDRTTLSKVIPGMTKTQVKTLLGAPQGTEGDHQWEYWRWGNAGWVEIWFDSSDAVTEINDESVFP